MSTPGLPSSHGSPQGNPRRASLSAPQPKRPKPGILRGIDLSMLLENGSKRASRSINPLYDAKSHPADESIAPARAAARRRRLGPTPEVDLGSTGGSSSEGDSDLNNGERYKPKTRIPHPGGLRASKRIANNDSPAPLYNRTIHPQDEILASLVPGWGDDNPRFKPPKLRKVKKKAKRRHPRSASMSISYKRNDELFKGRDNNAITGQVIPLSSECEHENISERPSVPRPQPRTTTNHTIIQLFGSGPPAKHRTTKYTRNTSSAAQSDFNMNANTHSIKADELLDSYAPSLLDQEPEAWGLVTNPAGEADCPHTLGSNPRWSQASRWTQTLQVSDSEDEGCLDEELCVRSRSTFERHTARPTHRRSHPSTQLAGQMLRTTDSVPTRSSFATAFSQPSVGQIKERVRGANILELSHTTASYRMSLQPIPAIPLPMPSMMNGACQQVNSLPRVTSQGPHLQQPRFSIPSLTSLATRVLHAMGSDPVSMTSGLDMSLF